MRLPQLQPARLIRRYKRFLADVTFEDGTEATIHCPNPGSMMGLATPGARVWTSLSPDPARKLPHTLELVEAENGALVDVNTMRPNKLAEEALAAGVIPDLGGYPTVRREVRYGEASRVDFLLEGLDRPACWVEVKGVTLSRTPGLCEWPDGVSARATKHLAELVARVEAGDRAVVLFIVQRSDCDRFTAAADIDPKFAKALAVAMAAGVEALVYSCKVTLENIAITAWIAP